MVDRNVRYRRTRAALRVRGAPDRRMDPGAPRFLVRPARPGRGPVPRARGPHGPSGREGGRVSPSLEIDRMLTLSTGHLPPSCREHDFDGMGIVHYTTEYGWILYAGSDPEVYAESEAEGSIPQPVLAL